MDSTNSLIFITRNNGKTIRRVPVPFHPSEISYCESDPRVVLILDKVDPMKQVMSFNLMSKLPSNKFLSSFLSYGCRKTMDLNGYLYNNM